MEAGDVGKKARLEEIEALNEHYEDVILNITDPQPEVDLMADPLMAAGVRALDRMRWELGVAAPPGVVPDGV